MSLKFDKREIVRLGDLVGALLALIFIHKVRVERSLCLDCFSYELVEELGHVLRPLSTPLFILS